MHRAVVSLKDHAGAPRRHDRDHRHHPARFVQLEAASVVFRPLRVQIEEQVDPAVERKRLVEELRQKMGAVPTGRAYGVDDIIDPRDTRAIVNRALDVFTTRDAKLPPHKHGIMPV